jgi:hypothetical protein
MFLIMVDISATSTSTLNDCWSEERRVTCGLSAAA